MEQFVQVSPVPQWRALTCGRMRVVLRLLRVPSTSHWHLPHQGDIAIIRHSLWRVLRHVHLSFIAAGAEWKCLDNYSSLFPSPLPPAQPASPLAHSSHTHAKLNIKTSQRVPARIYHCTYLMKGDSFSFSFLGEEEFLSHSWHLLACRQPKEIVAQKVTRSGSLTPLLQSTLLTPPPLLVSGELLFSIGFQCYPKLRLPRDRGPLGPRDRQPGEQAPGPHCRGGAGCSLKSGVGHPLGLPSGS